MTVNAEIQALRLIQEQRSGGGEITQHIISTKPGCLIFDVYSWEHEGKCIVWDVDAFSREMIVLDFNSKASFKKAYGLARLLRGKGQLKRM
ncbi:Uncharacterised protein [Klebsiella pneumoniae]|uniref:Uncharacterized protein n=2 Tax=Klebsiella pneumoniae TaxID=573 RepID=A0A378C7L4_KLEPO|nr:hypothetical protein [Klebsiella pneumoniae]MBU9719694.1 hypothetical protein [Klebsiella pneumoniae subsp. ozaenae]VFS27638.1 Uncharacterised protein [Serratia liquefaciens]AYJ94761.1 hypothetical protein D9K64_17235 [Klebsiella pneumoniae]SQC20987.1 Uncharacterised protein [Klebsiella pneumoniae]STR97380.1 Uncharacterised protein [Klebsiella pneumoniae]